MLSNKWLTSLSPATHPNQARMNQHQPLDLTLASMAAAQANQRQSCTDCKELRKEVKEVKHSLQYLIQQFNTFAGRWTNMANGAITPETTAASALQSNGVVSSQNSSPAVGDKPPQMESKDSPPSSLSSIDWSTGEILHGHGLIVPKREMMGSSPSVDSRTKLSSPDSASSGDSMGLSGAKKRKLSSLPKSNGANSAFTAANTLKHQQQHNQLKNQEKILDSTLEPPNRMDPSYLPLLQSQLLNHNPFHLQHLLMGWQSLAAGKMSDPALLTLQNLANPYSFPGSLGSVAGQDLPKSVSSSKIPVGAQHNSSVDVTSCTGGPVSTSSSELCATGPNPVHSNGIIDNGSDDSHHKNGTISTTTDKDQGFSTRKKPGPDDFIKEFVEHPEIENLEAATDRPLQIPVPEAFESDPDFRPASEDEILGSTRWDELEWQEAVTRLAKKLAERRVFGPMLMAKATVAGTNHSNYPNLPMDGILYIESVCRRTLFPQLSRRQFAEFFRPAVKGLAARCRRIRHSLKPLGGSHCLNQSNTSFEDTSFNDSVSSVLGGGPLSGSQLIKLEDEDVSSRANSSQSSPCDASVNSDTPTK